MYLVKKTMEIAYAHSLSLPYESKCQNFHGHNGIVTIYCKSKDVDKSTGMVIDFKVLKDMIHGKLDHACINEVIPGMNPTAENMARWICGTINSTLFAENRWAGCICYRVDFQESNGNVATYIDDEENVIC